MTNVAYMIYLSYAYSVANHRGHTYTEKPIAVATDPSVVHLYMKQRDIEPGDAKIIMVTESDINRIEKEEGELPWLIMACNMFHEYDDTGEALTIGKIMMEEYPDEAAILLTEEDIFDFYEHDIGYLATISYVVTNSIERVGALKVKDDEAKDIAYIINRLDRALQISIIGEQEEDYEVLGLDGQHTMYSERSEMDLRQEAKLTAASLRSYMGWDR